MSKDPPPSTTTSQPQASRPFPRIATDDPRREVTILGRRRSLRDVYHWLLTTPWWLFIVLGATLYLGVNLVFALLFTIDPVGLSQRTGRSSFFDAFFFSVETMGTIGYGVLYPQSLYANVVMTLENFVSLSLVAVSTGVIFARVSRPTARVLFSRPAVIGLYDGAPTLMFRAANERANQIMEAEVQISVARQSPTREGKVMRRLQDLRPVRNRSPLFALTWTILHVLDESSPLFGATPESLRAEEAEIIVVLSGVDETFAQRIHARYSYVPDDVVWNRQFADILSIDADGRRTIDYARFHEVDALDD